MMKGLSDKKSCDLNRALLNQDKFGQAFTMRIDDGRDKLPSKLGAICSLLLVIILITYAGYKISVLEGKRSIDIVQAVIENHFDDTHVFSNQQGLNIAVAVFSTF